MTFTRHGECKRCGRCCTCGIGGPVCPMFREAECLLWGKPALPDLCRDYPTAPDQVFPGCGFFFADSTGIRVERPFRLLTEAETGPMPDWMIEYMRALEAEA